MCHRLQGKDTLWRMVCEACTFKDRTGTGTDSNGWQKNDIRRIKDESSDSKGLQKNDMLRIKEGAPETCAITKQPEGRKPSFTFLHSGCFVISHVSGASSFILNVSFFCHPLLSLPLYLILPMSFFCHPLLSLPVVSLEVQASQSILHSLCFQSSLWHINPNPYPWF